MFPYMTKSECNGLVILSYTTAKQDNTTHNNTAAFII